MESGSTNADPLIGSFIGGKYRIMEKLGSGGMGGVYKAEHQLMNRIVAVKVLRSNLIHDEILLKRFHHEAKAASQISHPNAVILYDYGVENNLPFLVMEYIEGKTLKMIISDEKPLSVRRVAGILRQICSALDQAHRAGIVHRDVKPDNFMVRKGHDGEDIVKVLDFGVSKSIGMGGLESKDNNLTQAGTIIGTPQYISPEQCQGKELDARCDIYSLGVVSYEMLSGSAPFTAPTVLELLVKVLHQQAEPIRKFKPELNLPPAIDAAVMKAIEKDRDKRYSNILDFYHDFAKGAGVDEKPIAAAAPARMPLSVLVLSGLILLTLIFLIFRPPAGGSSRPADDKKLQQLSEAVKKAEAEKAAALASAERLRKEAEELLRNNDIEKAKIVQEQAVAAERAEKEMDASLQRATTEKAQMEALLSKMKETAAAKDEALRREQEASRKAAEEKSVAVKAAESARIEAEKKSAEMKAQVDKEKREALQRELEMSAQVEKEKAEALKAQQEAAQKAEREKQEAIKALEAAKAEAARLTEMAKKMELEKEQALKQMEAAQKEQAQKIQQQQQQQQKQGTTTPTAVVPDQKAVEAAKLAARKAKQDQEKLAEAIRRANEQREEALRRADQTRLEAARQAAAARKAEEEASQMRLEAERKRAEQPPPSEESLPAEEQPKKRRRCGPTWCL